MSIYSKSKLIRKFQRKFFTSRLEGKYISSFFEDLSQDDSNGKKIVIYAAIPYAYLTPFEVLLYNGLIAEGWDVKYYVYDEGVSIHELTTSRYSFTQRKKFIKNNWSLGKKFLEAANVKYSIIPSIPSKFSEILNKENSLQSILNFEHDGFNLGAIVKRVMFRHYKSVDIYDREDTLNIAKEYLKTVLMNYFNSKSIIDDYEPDIFMFSHGIYCSWEVVAEVCQKLNIDYVCYDRGKTRSSMNFNWNQSAPDWSFESAWLEFKDISLNKIEQNMVDKYFSERELQLTDVYAYNTKKKFDDIDSFKKSLGIAPNQKVITFFSNLIWDAANLGREEIFGSFLEAITYTLESFNKSDDIKFLLRPHPAERILGTNQKYSDLLTCFDDNLSIIDENLEANSFSVLEITDIAVTHTSTIGLEMAMLGKPSIILGATHYKGKGFTIDPSSALEYIQSIKDCLSILASEGPNAQIQKVAKKYFYMMMFLYQKTIPVSHFGEAFNSYEYPSFEALMNEDSTFQEILKEIKSSDHSSFVKWK